MGLKAVTLEAVKQRHVRPLGNPFRSVLFLGNISLNFENQEIYTDI